MAGLPFRLGIGSDRIVKMEVGGSRFFVGGGSREEVGGRNFFPTHG